MRQRTWELVDHGASRAEVTYTEEGDDIGRELLTLDPTDRTGCFAVRLADGSLIERLPVGHAHGMWRLRWVRSEVPRAEIEAVKDHEEKFAIPNERSQAPFRRRRDRTRAWFGNPRRADSSFATDVPDTTLADTEVLPLPVVQV